MNKEVVFALLLLLFLFKLLDWADDISRMPGENPFARSQ